MPNCLYTPVQQTYLFAQVGGLYLMMGRGLDRLQQVPAGCVIAIGGLGTAILKSATLCSTPAARPLAPMLFQVSSHPAFAQNRGLRNGGSGKLLFVLLQPLGSLPQCLSK